MNEARRQERPADEPSFEQSSQYLAIPLGGLGPAHGGASQWLRAWRRNRSGLLTAAALLLGTAGVLISAAPRTLSVRADGSHVYLGGVALTRTATSPVAGYTMYGGAAVVLLSNGRATTRASGAATLDGVRVSGACSQVPHAAALTERCSFSAAGARVTSTDTFDPRRRVWRRTYSDHATVEFAVPAGQTVIPVPLPLGR